MMRDCLSTLRDVRARPRPPAALLALPARRRGRRCDGRACARRWARSLGPPRRCAARAAGAPGLTGCSAPAALMCAALRRCSWASGARSRSTSTRSASSCGARASALQVMWRSACEQSSPSSEQDPCSSPVRTRANARSARRELSVGEAPSGRQLRQLQCAPLPACVDACAAWPPARPLVACDKEREAGAGRPPPYPTLPPPGRPAAQGAGGGAGGGERDHRALPEH